MEIEVWRDVVGYDGVYEVSSHGRVRSVDRVVETATGPRRFRGRVLRLGADSDGYPWVVLSVAQRKRAVAVHTLVLEAFSGSCPNGYECRHRNGVKTDNRVDNLVWGTATENADDRDAHGTRARGAGHGRAKLDAVRVLEIRERHAQGETQTKLARVFQVTVASINDIIHRRTWTHLE